MTKIQEQKNTLVDYFRAGCKSPAPLTLGLEVEHFITRANGAPVSFEEIQNVMRVMQKPNDETIMIDGLYMGYYNDSYGVSLEPACQIEISVVPQTNITEMVDIYEAFFTYLCMHLAGHGLSAHAVGFHPSCLAKALPLIPKARYQAMDRYFQTSGNHGIHMMRATASTQLSIDYFSEQDFVQKYRAACLITPLLVLLTDNAPIYQGKPNHAYSVRTHVWNDVDPDRCGILPTLMDEDFGFASYAEYVLQKPQVVALHSGISRGIGRKTAPEIYGAHLSKAEVEHILSMFFFDVRLKNYIEIRVADSMPPRFILAYAQLIRTIFSSPAAINGILRHYAGVTVQDIENAKLGICCNGYAAHVYARPVAEELAWLLAQAKSRIPVPDERRHLDPLVELVTTKKTIREVVEDE